MIGIWICFTGLAHARHTWGKRLRNKSRTHMRWLIFERYYNGINESRPESRQIQKQKLVVDLGNLYYPLLRIPFFRPQPLRMAPCSSGTSRGRRLKLQINLIPACTAFRESMTVHTTLLCPCLWPLVDASADGAALGSACLYSL